MSIRSQQQNGPNRRPTVILYNPRAVFFTMPLAVLAVASYLGRSRFEVIIVDGRLEDDPLATVSAHLDRAVCFGVTVLTGDPIRDALEVSRHVKLLRPELPVVWGGWHPSVFPRQCLEEPAVDVTVQGQGEITLADVLDRVMAGRDLEGCLGCAFRTPEGKIQCNPSRPMAEIEGFPSHDYSLIDVERYFQLKGRRQLDYISSQGCRYRCTFCADPFVYQRQWVGYPAERIGAEVESLWRRYRFDDLSFQDETFFTSSRRLEAVVEELLHRRLPITWAATMRADQGSRLSDELFAKCAASGLRRLIIGVESGSQATIDLMKKDIRLEQVFGCAEMLLRHGIAGTFPFIVGLPGESPESIQASLDVAKRLRAMSPKFTTPLFYYEPYPGTEITNRAVAEGYGLPQTLAEWAEFDFIGSAGPWVTPRTYRHVERFKFYQQLAWDSPAGWKRLLRPLARWRCEHDWYRLPMEKAIGEWIAPPERLS